jgi:hypothetical protein
MGWLVSGQGGAMERSGVPALLQPGSSPDGAAEQPHADGLRPVAGEDAGRQRKQVAQPKHKKNNTEWLPFYLCVYLGSYINSTTRSSLKQSFRDAVDN